LLEAGARDTVSAVRCNEGSERMPLRSIGRLTSAVVVLLGVQMLLMVAQAGAFIHRIGLLRKVEAGEFVSQSQGEAADNFVAAVGGIAAIALIATVVVWCVWQHHGQRNAVELSTTQLQFTPGWAVGWWFIPFANLVKPFQTVRELWKASHGDDAAQRLPTAAMIGWWWALWIASNIHIWFGPGQFSVGLGTSAWATPVTIEAAVNRDAWEIVSLVLSAGAAVLAIGIVRSVGRLQAVASATHVPAPPIALPPTPDLPPPPVG
jgi:hypothetical protein